MQLAAPLGGSTLTPVPVVAASAQGALTAADQAWLQRLQQDLGRVPTVVRVRDLGLAPDGQAAQLQVLSNVSGGGSGSGLTTLVNDLRGTISRDRPPPGLSVHLAGAVAINADQQSKSGSTDSQIQLLSIVFILGRCCWFSGPCWRRCSPWSPPSCRHDLRSAVAEAAHHGLKVSPLAQILLIVLVLGAGTDYGLFLVFRVRENLRAGLDRRQAVIAAVEKVGSRSRSRPPPSSRRCCPCSSPPSSSLHLGIPLAIGIGVILLAGLTLLPALLAIFGRAVFWPSKTQAGTGKTGVWGRVSARIVSHPAPTLVVGLVVFGGLALRGNRVYRPPGSAGIPRHPRAPTRRPGAAILVRPLPGHVGQPDEHHLQAPAACLE